MALKTQKFTAGTTIGDGVAVTLANSDDAGDAALSVISAPGGTIVYEQDHPALSGHPWSALVTNSTTGNPTIVGLNDTAATSFATRVYFYLTGYPTVSGSFGMRVQTGTAGQGVKAFITTTGQIMIVGSFGTTNGTGTVIPLNTWIRWEFWATGLTTSSTVCQTAFYLGHSTTAQQSITTGTVTSSGTENAAEIRYGRAQSAMNMAPFYVTGIAQNIGTGTPIGPSVIPPILRDLTSNMGVSDYGSRTGVVRAAVSPMGLTDPMDATLVSTAFEGWGMPL